MKTATCRWQVPKNTRKTETYVTEPTQNVLEETELPEVHDDTSARGSVRLCIGCRQTADRDELLRFAIAEGPPWLAPDPNRKLGGRGVSVHPSRECLLAAAKKGGFARALRRRVDIDAEALCAAASELYRRRVESLLLAASRRKRIALGTEAVREALRRSEVSTLVVATDAEGRRDELAAAADRLGARCAVVGTKSSLGKLFGRDELGVLGIRDAGIGDEIVCCAARAAQLEVQ